MYLPLTIKQDQMKKSVGKFAGDVENQLLRLFCIRFILRVLHESSSFVYHALHFLVYFALFVACAQ